jgi:hypothetical protein
VVDDVGRVINPMICHGQIDGALAQGIGQALMENVAFDPESGQMLSASFMDYAMPRATDFAVHAEMEFIDVPAKTNPLGVKGIGEAGCVGAPPAVMNAASSTSTCRQRRGASGKRCRARQRSGEHAMRIAIIGAGNVGRALEAGWKKSGHEVRFGKRESNKDAAQWGELVVLATPWPATKDAIAACGSLAGKVVLDATNPLLANLAGLDHAEGSGGERVARWAAGAKVVKIFNTTGFNNMLDARYAAGKPMMLYCGDDAGAKGIARRLAEDLGFDPIDFGPLANARYSENVAMSWIWLAIKGGIGRDIAFVLARR